MNKHKNILKLMTHSNLVLKGIFIAIDTFWPHAKYGEQCGVGCGETDEKSWRQ